jgi:hypothetical protein
LLTPFHLLAPLSEDGAGIIHAVTFCDPTITPGRLVVIADGSPAQKAFRAESCVYAGDTDANAPWTLSMALRRITTL